MKSFKAAWIQGKSQGNLKKNIDYYSKKITQAAESGSKMIILPELFLSDYFPITEDKKNFTLAITTDSDIVKNFRDLAKSLKIVLIFPFFEKQAEGIYHNSCLVIENNGEIVGHYRKMHIPDDPGFYEKYYFTPGDLGFTAVKTSLGKIGVMICWDQWFPEAARIMALNGAELIIYPTAIAWDDNEPKNVYPEQLDAWITMMRSHAIANGIHILAANRVGQEGHLNFWGHSFMADPYGNIVHQDKTTEVISEVEVDFDKTKECRNIWPFFRDRRVDKYSSLLKLWDNN